MQLRNKLAIVTAAASLAFVGTGFAAWVFTKTVNDSADVTAKVTCGIEANNVKVYNGAAEIEDVYVVFDAPTTAGVTRKAGEGIFYCSDIANPSTTKITSLKLVGQIDHVENDLHYMDSNEQVEFTVVETNNIPAAQVGFAAGSIANSVQDIVVGDNEYEAVYTLPALSYVSAPESFAELGTFKTAVSGSTIHLAFTFGVKA